MTTITTFTSRGPPDDRQHPTASDLRLPTVLSPLCRRRPTAAPGSKKCAVKDWARDDKLVHPPDQPPSGNHGIGLRLGHRLRDGRFLVAVDADRDELVRFAQALVPSPCGRIGQKGIAPFARVQDESKKFDLKLHDGEKCGDFLGDRAFVVIPPTIHPDTNRPYRWVGTPLLELGGSQHLPVVDSDLIDAAFRSEHLPALLAGEATHDAMLKYIGVLANLTDDFDHIEQIVRAAFPLDYRGNSLDELAGMLNDTRKKFERGDWIRTGTAQVGDAPPFSEEHLALEFAARHASDFYYVPKGLGWMVWTGARWEPDDTLSAYTLARAICREFSHKAAPTIRRSVASAKTRAAVVSLAQNDERIAADADRWDADPWLLNTPKGTVDLKTGELRPHNRNDYITKVTAVAPDPDCLTPLWAAFLERVTNGDRELQDYLQRACGYSLTGVTYEHSLLFLYGTGANGKSTFIEAITRALGDYARPVPGEALMWSRNERHPTDIAGLRGVRIASAVETGKGRSWDEPKVLLLTGGDRITARFMRQDFFDFWPQFKLWIAGNHKPGLRSVNEAIRRRLHLVPFLVTIPVEERDKQLGEKLRAEAPGILQWMIEGCLQWQRIGLAPPAVVTQATDDYAEEQDLAGQWLEDCCEVDKTFEERSSLLFASWQKWNEAQGEKAGHQRGFNDMLEQKGFKRDRDKKVRTFRGLRLTEAERKQGQQRQSQNEVEQRVEQYWHDMDFDNKV